MVEQLPVVLWSVDRQLRITSCFGGGLYTAGTAPEELVGATLFQLFETDDEDWPPIAACRRAIQGERVTGEFDWRGRPFRVQIAPLRDAGGQIVGCIGSSQDVTDRKLAEEAIRESEEEYRTLFEGAAEGILVADMQTRMFHYVNPAICKMLGYTEEELKQMSVADIHPKEALEYVLSQFEAQARGEFALAAELPCLRKDGTTVYADISAGKIMLGGQACMVGFFTDVTQRKLAEEAIQKEQRLLRRLLHLQEQDRKLTAYEIHDELAQQLAGVQMRLQSFAQQHQTEDNKVQVLLDEALDLLSRCVNEARRLISGLRPPIIDEAGIVAAIDFLVHEHNKQDGPKTEFHHNVRFNRLAPPLETAVFRIVQETLTNARRYSQSEKVRIEFVAKDDRVRVEIRDWGIGFDPAKIKENRFGLQGIRERARLLGGRAIVEAAPGEGTRIAVELPLVEAADR